MRPAQHLFNLCLSAPCDEGLNRLVKYPVDEWADPNRYWIKESLDQYREIIGPAADLDAKDMESMATTKSGTPQSNKLQVPLIELLKQKLNQLSPSGTLQPTASVTPSRRTETEFREEELLKTGEDSDEWRDDGGKAGEAGWSSS